jgi:hypothetical protein
MLALNPSKVVRGLDVSAAARKRRFPKADGVARNWNAAKKTARSTQVSGTAASCRGNFDDLVMTIPSGFLKKARLAGGILTEHISPRNIATRIVKCSRELREDGASSRTGCRLSEAQLEK